MSPADNTPDFDAMSPEELMAWMETLAERQGATEGFTTDKRMEIEEIDPDTVEDSGPGYIPFGMSEEQWAKKQQEEAARKAAARQTQAPPPAQPSARPPAAEVPPPPPPTPQRAPEPAPQVPSGIDWLASFGTDSADESFPEMDLSNLGAELESLDLDVLGSEQTDPMQWLDSLVEEQGSAFNLPFDALEMPSSVEPAEELPAMETDDVDPLEWLESLARSQGAAPEEFVTPARASVPSTEAETPAESYQDYTFETEGTGGLDQLDAISQIDPDDPVAWLESLAAAQNPSAHIPQVDDNDDMLGMDEEDLIGPEDDTQQVIAKLNEGISDPDVMRGWMDNLLEQGASRTDIPDYIEDEDDESEAIEAELPDWLLEQVGMPPAFDDAAAVAEPETTPVEGDTAAALPDWLQDEAVSDSDEVLENIFVDEETPSAAVAATSEPAIDTSDPWVEAFELERTEMADPDQMPAWYAERLQTLEQGTLMAEVEEAEEVDQPVAQGAVNDAMLASEPDLASGEPEPVPTWITGVPEEAAAEQVIIFEDVVTPSAEEAQKVGETLPDWLHLEEEEPVYTIDDGEELPDWLKEAAMEEATSMPDWLVEEPAAAVPAPPEMIIQQPEPVQPMPEPIAAPSPTSVGTLDVSETLERARERLVLHDVEGGLQDYEAVIRVSAQLSDVVQDLSELIRQDEFKANPAVYRVLGDGLMRLGRLQDALDTYRKALNLL